MSSKNAIKVRKMKQSFQNLSLETLRKPLAISGLVLFLFYTLLFNQLYNHSITYFSPHFKVIWPASSSNVTSPTNINHIVFGIAGTVNGWKFRRAYVEAWWRPNVTRGYLFLERFPSREFLPWPPSSPPFRVNENITRLKSYEKIKNSFQVRVFRTILETFREGDEDVRWYVMADDDTILFVDNLVEVLAKYDHTQYLYIGTNSECVSSNFYASFNMAFGGAGYALSYPLVEALAAKFDKCVEKYQNLYASDLMLYSCLADLGVTLTLEKGFHQVTYDHASKILNFSKFLNSKSASLYPHGECRLIYTVTYPVSLSALPQIPVLSLHHLDVINPIFPSMSRCKSINHLMKAAKLDHSRLLQQTICYDMQRNWSFSISWGYTTHIYESIFPRNFVVKPLETFRPWRRSDRQPLYMFNTRGITRNSCEAPHVFFFHSAENSTENKIATTYLPALPRNLPPCSNSGNISADSINTIHVFSPATEHKRMGKTECCDVEKMRDVNVTDIKLRKCTKDEIIS